MAGRRWISANQLTGAQLIIQKAQYETAFADTVTTPGFSPELYDQFTTSEMLIVDGEHDVFGDGRVRLIPAPGHTLGHQVLFVDLAETGPVVLSGDLHILRFGHENRRVPSFNADSTQSVESMERIDAFLEESGSALWIGHELARFNELKKPPLYQD